MNRLRVMAAMTLRTGLAILVSALPAFANKPLGEVQTDQHRVRIVELADNLEHPWSVAFLPDGGFLVTERPGRLWRFSADGRERQPISGLPDVYASGQGGLLDIVASPDFADSQTVYLSYAAGGFIGGANTRLARARLSQNRLENLKVLFSAQPNHEGGLHFGGRIVVLSDGSLSLTIGERGQKSPAQNLMDHSGSVIRVMADGQVPADNPFVSRSDALPEIYSFGHRNPQGAAIHPKTGQLWIQEHGPRGGDEVNLIRAGANYGWPLVSHGVNYNGLPVGAGNPTAPGVTDPIYTWVPSIAPSGMAFYQGDAFPKWRGNLLVGALKDQLVSRLTLDGEQVVSEERFLQRAVGRIRDVRVGPDGLVYLLTDAQNGRLLRLEPAD